jgi:hypothetical protein
MHARAVRKKSAKSGRDGAPVRSPRVETYATRLLPVFPVLLAVLLALPAFRFPYLSDDFDFLYSAQTFRPSMLLPSSGIVFYRPLSRELYFLIVNGLGGPKPLAGHLLNGLVLTCVVLLVMLVVRDLLGRRAAILASVVFACFAQLPFLVGFVSGIQDLMAIGLFLLALHLALRASDAAAVIVFALSLLAKETVVVLAPLLVALPWIQRRPRRQLLASAFGYALVLGAWLVIHPGIRILASHVKNASSTTYVGLYAGNAGMKALMGLRTVLNLPPSGAAYPWPDALTPVFVLGVALLGATFWTYGQVRWPLEELPSTAPRWVLAIGAYLVVVPALGIMVLVRAWSPYYLCFSAVGVAVLAAAALRSRGWVEVFIVMIAWLAIGIWSRGDRSIDPTIATEVTFAKAGQELGIVKNGFRQLRPAFPESSRVYISVMGRGLGSVRDALQRYQCLRVWYQEPTLRTADPLDPLPGSGPEFQFVVRKNLAVDEVIFHEGDASTPPSVDIILGKPASGNLGIALALALRNRAIGLAVAGDVNRAAEMLLSFPIPAYRTFHWRLASVFLLATGRTAEAEALMAAAPFNNGDEVLSDLYLYFIHTEGVQFDEAAFRCFPVPSGNAHDLRLLRDRLESEGYRGAALRCARRLVMLLPESDEAREALKLLERRPEVDRVTRRAND